MIDDHTPQTMAMQQLQGSGNCICQEQHRRGYCTEPGCSYNCKKAAARIEALEAALRRIAFDTYIDYRSVAHAALAPEQDK